MPGILTYFPGAGHTVADTIRFGSIPYKRGEITLVEYVVSLDKLGNHDVERVGGKNASLGEMISNLAGAGVSVPGGFATTAQAYRDFLEQSGLNERINAALDSLDVDDVNALAKTGAQIRQWIPRAAGCRHPCRLRRNGRG